MKEKVASRTRRKKDSTDAVASAPATAEHRRLAEAYTGGVAPWRKWGPYVGERSWGTVREDYSADGSAWDYFPHDHARSRAYRWGEDGIAGICDRYQLLVFALAFWNGRDPILKERMFGLTCNEGNRGEDVKDYWFYLDNTPTHSYMRMLYKYPQAEFPTVSWWRRTGGGRVSANSNCWTRASSTKIATSISSSSMQRIPRKISASASRPAIAARTLPNCTFCRTSGFATDGLGQIPEAASRSYRRDLPARST